MQHPTVKPNQALARSELLRIALGAIWLLDGLLQLQPYMFTTKFAARVIEPSAAGQPRWVADGVMWNAHLIAAHPVLADSFFATAQVLLGLAILVPRTSRLGLGASIGWALGVWYFGEGLGGVASASGNLLTGTPGAVILYACLALVLLAGPRSGRAASVTARGAWCVTWLSGAGLALAGGQYSPAADRATFGQAAAAGPAWLAGTERDLGNLFATAGLGVALVVLEVLIGLGAFAPGAWRRWAACAGAAVAIGAWLFGEDMGQLWSGAATDPNSGPLLVLLAVALASSLAWELTAPGAEVQPAELRLAGHRVPSRRTLAARKAA